MAPAGWLTVWAGGVARTFVAWVAGGVPVGAEGVAEGGDECALRRCVPVGAAAGRGVAVAGGVCGAVVVRRCAGTGVATLSTAMWAGFLDGIDAVAGDVMGGCTEGEFGVGACAGRRAA